VAPPAYVRNPYLTSHRNIGERHGSRVVRARSPFYLRAVHDLNDSRTLTDETRLVPEDYDAVFRYFPFLEPHFRVALPIAAE